MRTRPLTAILLVVSLIVLPIALAQGQGQSQRPAGTGAGAGADAGRGPSERAAMADEEQRWNNLSQEARERGLARAENARLFGKLNFSNGAATGRFVSFNLTDGNIADYAVRDNTSTVFFRSIDAAGFGGNSTPRVTGAVLRLQGGEASLAAHNNPAAMLSYRAGNASLSLTLATPAGVNVTEESNRSLMLATGGIHGHVILQGNATYGLGNSTAGSDGIITVTLEPGAGLLFAAHPPRAPGAQNLHAVRDAIASDRVGGLLSVVEADNATLEDRVFLGVAMKASKVAQNRTEIVVSSDEPRGRAVVIHLDASVLNVTGGRNVTVTLDGERMNATANAATALNSSQATYHANASAQGIQLIVSVPSFSDHTIGVSVDATQTQTQTTPTVSPTSGTGTTTATPTPTGTSGDDDTPGPGLLLVVAAAAVALLARRK